MKISKEFHPEIIAKRNDKHNRYGFENVQYDFEHGYAVATDQICLVALPIDRDSADPMEGKFNLHHSHHKMMRDAMSKGADHVFMSCELKPEHKDDDGVTCIDKPQAKAANNATVEGVPEDQVQFPNYKSALDMFKEGSDNKGEPTSICINPKMLLDVAKAIGAPGGVVLEYRGPKIPILIRANDERPANEEGTGFMSPTVNYRKN